MVPTDYKNPNPPMAMHDFGVLRPISLREYHDA